MYKLIIGNVRIAVHDESIERQRAIAAAHEAVQKAGRSGKQLSQIDLFGTDTGISITVTEKTGLRAGRKTLRQSMYDSILAAAEEKLAATQPKGQDNWSDSESGQQWHGSEVTAARSQVLTELKNWLKPN